ncbi:alpha-glucuronidase family glycosyl hydrolase [Rhodothermus marinus]|uniref:Xylan alpha-1,2-glucuronidase n=1 Tax=Rhodothermus marinus (strain ATCC 43812 / DSM 4252 / R-10) TaxID=518766 RepID=D0MHL3_RHOM4|nr:alpha-glucuronidase family glycosyl hydrolase [Rhodothermus marinus]ACY47971.1 Alpha-glucuronidase [Rhodothermus marinus DSM 4252]
MHRLILWILLLAGIGFWSRPGVAEDGYQLWLRYVRIEDEALRQRYLQQFRALHLEATSPTLEIVQEELRRGLQGLLGTSIPSVDRVEEGVLLVGTPASCPTVAALGLEAELQALGDEGFLLRTMTVEGHRATVLAAASDVGVLYGAFHLLRLLQTHRPIDSLNVREAPRVRLRVLNHWDNLDRTVERGYAGFSLWDWFKLPDYIDPRYRDYARANASLGINGTVLTNVNADARVLLPEFLEKVAALADIFRPYGIRVYLTARFSAPIEIGGLDTADPLDPDVRAWWREKVAEIYRYIPDFGGFLVKANSEGQPGPQDYGRTHADGANMLAEALAPYGGVVMWRAFVYAPEAEDRVKQAYDEFVPLDGQFRENVLIQVKNGPLDFQPREPFHPLFGAMPRTPLMMEFQITKEYLGFSTHLAYLGTLWEEVLQADTYARGEGSTVARVIDGSLFGRELTGMAGVANIGTDRNWCGSIFDQANWYAFGRLAWNPDLRADSIAEEWIRMTFTNDPRFVAPVKQMMLESREAVVNYMTPLGLAHLMGPGHHYGPAPWFDQAPRPDWNNTYYHRADTLGIGFDRTATGSNAVAQYFSPLREIFGSLERCPEKYLLWFHHVPWDYRMRSGRTLWEELVDHYYQGVETVRRWQSLWKSLRAFVDPERFEQIATFLRIQEKEAVWWRDACVLYFQTFSRRPIPAGYEQPAHTLDYYIELQRKLQRFPMPGHWVGR